MTEFQQYNDCSVFFAPPPVRDGVIVVVRALLFYEGVQTDSKGNKHNYSPALLQRIVDNSNQVLEEGRRIPLFKDHAYNQDSVIGKVRSVSLEDITEDNLPSKRLSRLVGKKGIYGQVQISGEENVVRYGDDRLDTLSVGIDLINERIKEVSAVPFPAVLGVSLFEEYGLNLQQTEKDWNTPMRVFNLFEDTLNSIDQSSETNKDALKLQAIADLADKLKESLGIPPPSLIPLFNQEPMENTEIKPTDTAAIAQYEARIAELETAGQARFAEMQDKLAQLERTNEITAQYTELKDRAAALRDSGKMTPAAYKEYFGEPKQAIATYSAAVADGGKDISAAEAVVTYLETFGAPVVTFGRKTPLESLDEVENSEEDLEAEAKGIINAASKYGESY